MLCVRPRTANLDAEYALKLAAAINKNTEGVDILTGYFISAVFCVVIGLPIFPLAEQAPAGLRRIVHQQHMFSEILLN